MKKIFMTLVACVMTICASAQVYVGGNAGIASIDNGGDDDETIYSLLPEVGYKFSNDWALGVAFGWSKGQLQMSNGDMACSNNLTKTFEINPYVRYTALHGKLVNLFVDGAFGYKHYNGGGETYSLGLKPGVELKLDKFSLVAKCGFVGWQKSQYHHAKTTVWGVDFDTNNISLGVLYNF